MPIDSVEQQLLTQLQSLANGLHPQGGKVAMSDRLEAGRRYKEIKARHEAEERRRAETDRQHFLEEERQRLAGEQQTHDQDMDQSKLMLEAELERRRLDQEQEKIEIEKAKVVIQALEVAARNPELARLTDVVGELSYRLLGGEALPALEDKSRADEES